MSAKNVLECWSHRVAAGGAVSTGPAGFERAEHTHTHTLFYQPPQFPYFVLFQTQKKPNVFSWKQHEVETLRTFKKIKSAQILFSSLNNKTSSLVLLLDTHCSDTLCVSLREDSATCSSLQSSRGPRRRGSPGTQTRPRPQKPSRPIH